MTGSVSPSLAGTIERPQRQVFSIGSTTGRFVRLLIASLVIFVASACGDRLPTYRYRMTVEVETPEGLRTGSSVIEVRTHEGSAFPGPEAASMQSQVRGEAVVVDLGPRGVLFALLTSADRQTGAGGYAWALLPNPPTGGESVEARRANYEALRSVRGSAELPAHMYPMLVRFREISDPVTVEQVGPAALPRAFGEGVRLRRITVEMTDDPVTNEIRRRLGWLADHPEPRLDPEYKGSIAPKLSERLSHGDFVRGSR